MIDKDKIKKDTINFYLEKEIERLMKEQEKIQKMKKELTSDEEFIKKIEKRKNSLHDDFIKSYNSKAIKDRLRKIKKIFVYALKNYFNEDEVVPCYASKTITCTRLAFVDRFNNKGVCVANGAEVKGLECCRGNLSDLFLPYEEGVFYIPLTHLEIDCSDPNNLKHNMSREEIGKFYDSNNANNIKRRIEAIKEEKTRIEELEKIKPRTLEKKEWPQKSEIKHIKDLKGGNYLIYGYGERVLKKISYILFIGKEPIEEIKKEHEKEYKKEEKKQKETEPEEEKTQGLTADQLKHLQEIQEEKGEFIPVTGFYLTDEINNHDLSKLIKPVYLTINNKETLHPRQRRKDKITTINPLYSYKGEN